MTQKNYQKMSCTICENFGQHVFLSCMVIDFALHAAIAACFLELCRILACYIGAFVCTNFGLILAASRILGLVVLLEYSGCFACTFWIYNFEYSGCFT